MAFRYYTGIICILYLTHNRFGQAQVPCGGTVLGNDHTVNRTEKETVETDLQFLVEDPATCYGAVESWNFWHNGPYGLCLDLLLQVWRPTATGGDYELIGTNPYVCGGVGDGPETIVVPKTERIPMQPGDVYGWVDLDGPGNESRLFTYDEASTASGQFFETLILPEPGCSDTAGDVCLWNLVLPEVRGYSLNAVLVTRPNPYFINLPKTISILEMTAAGTFVYRAMGFNDFNYNDVVNPELSYSITGGDCAAQFDIDPVTGAITTTATELNYEAGINCFINVRVEEGPNFDQQRLDITIIDVNEPHTIDNLPVTVSISAATTGNNAQVYRVTFSDIDTSTAWPDKTYSIVSSDPPSGPFDITRVNPTTGRVHTTQNLAFWSGSDRYSLQILATDGQHGSGPLELVVEITDIREDPHLKNLDAKGIQLLETETNSVLVFKVEAETNPLPNDARGTITYQKRAIYPLTTPINLFSVDPTTGDVRNRANPNFDYASVQQYTIEIEAVWLGPPDLVSAPGNLTVDIERVNKPPYHEAWAKVFHTSIMELEAVGTVLPDVVLDADDRDIMYGDYVDYTVDTPWLRADNVTKRLYVQQLIALGPGHQYQETFTFEILVIDSYGMYDNATLHVTVTDINDHSPVFFGDPYIGSIIEDDPGGTSTGVNLTVSDEDAGVNAQLRFIILEPIPASYFQVEEKPAGSKRYVVTNKQPIPYEVYQNMTFTVMAIDNGDDERNVTAVVFIEILEGNTNIPFFDPDFAVMDLRSDTPIGDAVYTVVAQDLDSPSVQYLSYYWLIIDDFYRLDELSGDVIVNRELLAKRKHLLYLAAQDQNHHGNDKHHSKPFTLRIDTYKAESTLVDIFLDIPLADFLVSQTLFLDTLNAALPQWDVRIETVRLQGSQTVVRVYAVESALPDLPQNQHLDKEFIDEDDLVRKLRKRLRGTPRDFLLGPSFAQWQPVKVAPAYPVWIIDTPGGVALLTILCALFVGGIITMFVLLARKYGWCCYKNRKTPQIRSAKVKPAPETKDPFKLNYLKDGETPYHISGSKPTAYNGPILPMTTFRSPPLPLTKENLPKSDSDGAIKKVMRTSLNEQDPERHLPPVQQPEAQVFRPPPRQRGGEAA